MENDRRIEIPEEEVPDKDAQEKEALDEDSPDLDEVKRTYRAKCDRSIGSKYFGCLPLNVISVKGLGAISFVVHLFEVILAVTCFCFIMTFNLTHRTRGMLVSAIWLEIGISSSIMIVSAILCFGRLVEVWLCIRSIATTIQILLAAVIIGLVWSEFEKDPTAAALGNVQNLHILIFALWLLTYVITLAWSDYAWRAVYCKCFYKPSKSLVADKLMCMLFTR